MTIAGLASDADAAGPIGLTCTAPNGATMRLNLDIGARRFQKEGFPARSIMRVTAKRLVLMREKLTDFTVTASIDRDTMTYIADSEDAKSHAMTETRYACAEGPSFEVAGAGRPAI
jgi:hypothetical protein